MISQNLVFLAPISWDELQRNGYRKTAGAMFKSFVSRAEIEHIWYIQMDRRWGPKVRHEKVAKNLDIIGLPIGLPYSRLALVRTINLAFQAKLLQKIAPSLFSISTERLYWFYDWTGIEFIKRLPYGLTVMEITDSAEQFAARSPAMLQRLPELRQQVQEHADIVFVVNPDLAREVQSNPPKVSVMPNGISKEFLERASVTQAEPQALIEIGKPRLCVVGTQWSLNYRLDHQLLIEVMQLLQTWQLILVGCERIESSGLSKLAVLPQVHTVGMVPQEQLVAFIQHSDVCAVPYVQLPALRDTLKTYEYLACGKPVILTADDVVSELQPFVRKANNSKIFAQACQELLSSGNTQQSVAVRQILQTMTWDQRAEKCLSVCQTVAKGKE